MKLSEFTYDKAWDITEKILPHTKAIAANADVRKAMKDNGMTYTAFLTGIAKYARDDAVAIFAALNDIDVEEYKAKASAATVINDLFSLLYDDELMTLFGLAAPNLDKTSSNAASTNEAEKAK